jgi:hypothetical protein
MPASKGSAHETYSIFRYSGTRNIVHGPLRAFPELGELNSYDFGRAAKHHSCFLLGLPTVDPRAYFQFMAHTSVFGMDNVQPQYQHAWSQTNAIVTACRAFSIISGAFLAGINISQDLNTGFIGSAVGPVAGIVIAIGVEVAIRRVNR